MIVSLIASIVYWQLNYTYTDKSNKGDLKNYDLAVQVLLSFSFTTNTTFNLAHWVFAFSYLVLSYQIELTAKNSPKDTYSRRLNIINFLVCLLNVVVTAIYWIYAAKNKS